jgi:hypothetical protein
LDSFHNQAIGKKKFTQFIVCHIDCSSLESPLLESERSKEDGFSSARMKSIVESSGFTFVRIPLEHVFLTDAGAVDTTLVPELIEKTGTLSCLPPLL